MKVIYDVSTKTKAELNFELEIKEFFKVAPVAFSDRATAFVEGHISLRDELTKTVMELTKFQLMWALRSMESEINSAGGIIKILPDGDIEFRNFSDELIVKMKSLLYQNM